MRPNNGNLGNMPPQVTDAELRRRQQLIRLGLLLCFGLALMDNGTPTTPGISETATSRTSIPKATDTDGLLAQLSRLNKMINSQKLPTSPFFAHANGIYRGKWRRLPGGNSSSTTQDKGVPLVGKFTLQIRSFPISRVDNLSFVYGILQAEGLFPSSFPSQNAFVPMQGISSKVDGSLTLLATPTRSQKLFFSLPIFPNISDRLNHNHQIHHSLHVKLMNSSNSTGDEVSNSKHAGTGSLEEFEPLAQLGSDLNHTILKRFLRSAPQNEVAKFALPYFLPDDPKVRHNISDRVSPFLSISAPMGTSGVDITAVPLSPQNTLLQSLYSLEHGLGDGVVSEPFRAYQSNSYPPTLSSLKDVSGETKVPREKKIPQHLLLSHCLIVAKLWSDPSNADKQRAKKIHGKISSQPLLDFESTSSCALLSDINVSLELFEIEGKLMRKTYWYCLIQGIVCVLQIYLLTGQLRHVQTQAAASKLSVISILGQALVDSLLCVLHLLLSNLFSGEYFYYFIPIVLLKLLMFGIFEMRMVILVYQARFGQELGANWGTLRQYLALIHIRFYVCLFGAMFFIFCFQKMPVIIILALYSFWFPQIIINALRGIRKPFAPTYVLSMSLCRMFFPLYLLGCPDNIFAAIEGRDPAAVSPLACVTVVVWLGGQVLLLHLQDEWGPRFFLPASMLPVTYNYERPLPAHIMPTDGPEGGLLPECVICYNGVDPWQRNYMITPCDHIFHRDCLTEWLNHKMECPVCRAALPSAESD